jgi:uncharacterized protein YceK
LLKAPQWRLLHLRNHKNLQTLSIQRSFIRHTDRTHSSGKSKAMLELTLIVFTGTCVVVFGTGPKDQAKEGQSSGAFLATLLEKLKNSSERCRACRILDCPFDALIERGIQKVRHPRPVHTGE